MTLLNTVLKVKTRMVVWVAHVSFVYFDLVAVWRLWFTTAAQHHRSLLCYLSVAQEKMNTRN